MKILRSSPGIATAFGPTLLSEVSEASQRRHDQALCRLSDVARVARRSAKSRIVLTRQGSNVRLRNAVYHWARIAARRDQTCEARHKAP